MCVCVLVYVCSSSSSSRGFLMYDHNTMTIDLRFGHFTHSDFPRQYSSPGQALSLCTAVTRRPVCVSLSHSCCLYVPCRLYQDNICSLIFRYEGLSQQQSVCPPLQPDWTCTVTKRVSNLQPALCDWLPRCCVGVLSMDKDSGASVLSSN